MNELLWLAGWLCVCGGRSALDHPLINHTTSRTCCLGEKIWADAACRAVTNQRNNKFAIDGIQYIFSWMFLDRR
jgi:hypothetical protein